MTIRTLFIFSLALTFFSCQDKDPLEHSGCGFNDPIKSVNGATGFIHYTDSTGEYVIYAAIPGTIDSQDVGVVCNMPAEYEIDGLSVHFSGAYYQFDREVLSGIAGQEFYYLRLTSIQSAE